MSYRTIISLSVCLALFSFSDSWGQQTETSNSELKYWIQAGNSVTTLGPGINGGITFDFNNHVLSLRTVSTDMNYGTETWDVALLYGRSMTYQSLYFSAGVGASVIGGKSYSRLFGSENSTKIETTMGFPLEGRVSWEPTGFVALGVYSFANVNTEQPFGGIGLSIRLGNF